VQCLKKISVRSLRKVSFMYFSFFSFPPSALCLQVLLILHFAFRITLFSTLIFVCIFFFSFFHPREHCCCITMVRYMYHLTLFVVSFNILKPTPFGRQIASKRSTDTVLVLLIFTLFRKLRKATFSVLSVRRSLRMGQLGSHWMDSHEI
jgi:hypothetical protein